MSNKSERRSDASARPESVTSIDLNAHTIGDEPFKRGPVELHSDLISLTFERTPDFVKNVSFACHDMKGKEIGEIRISRLELDQMGDLLKELFGLGESIAIVGNLHDPFPEFSRLRSALEVIHEEGIPIKSCFGNTPEDIFATLSDRVTEGLTIEAMQKLLSVEQIYPGVYHIKAPNEHLLGSTFLRFQEHFESPFFRGKVFTFEQFKRWYTKDKDQFSYYSDWGGFNLPDYVFDSFREGNRFHPLTSKEKALLRIAKSLEKPFYIIGTYGENSAEEQRHELGHALYYLNDEYRAEVREVLKGVKSGPIRRYLRRIGYHEASLEDEVHAYLIDPLVNLKEEDIDVSPYRGVHRKLNRILDRYLEGK